METLTKGLCQHIIACSPTSIGDPEDDPVAKKEDEERLVLQEYALEEDTLVREILELNQLTVTDFVRFECGEVLPEENDWKLRVRISADCSPPLFFVSLSYCFGSVSLDILNAFV